MKSMGWICALGLFAASMQGAITTQDLSQVTPEQLGALLSGPGITITNVTFKGANNAAGSFTGGTAAGLGIEGGVILSSGDIQNVIGPNDATGKGSSLQQPGDPDLDALIPPNVTRDATILEFDFVAESSNFAIRYVFGSEEYKEYVGSPYNDVFGFFLDGANIAYVAGSASQLVSVNSINHAQNTQFYVDNPTSAPLFDTQLDGFTTVLIAAATVTPGQTHHIKLAIADATDSILDSVVILAAGGITGAPLLSLVADPYENFLDLGSSSTFTVHGFGFKEGVRYELAAAGLPEGSSVSFEPTHLEREVAQSAEVTVSLPATAFPKRYVLELRAVPDDPDVSTALGSALITVECRPPMILAVDQPASVTVQPGATAVLRVKATGSGPFTYQWYEGPRGSVWFPIEGATEDSFVTPPIQHSRSFWVRVENGCGTTDSATARVSTPSTRASRPAGRE